MQARKSRAAILARRGKRPAVQLGVDRLAAVTVSRYSRQVMVFELFLKSHGGSDILTHLQCGALQALLVWVNFYLQVGYDSCLLGLGDVANFVAGLRWHLGVLAQRHPLPSLDFESLLKPIRVTYNHWKDIEPYDFRSPVPLEVALALAGWAISQQRLGFAAFVLASWHLLLRPGEALSALAGDFWLGCPGIMRVRNPKIKWPRTQHVLVECPLVSGLLWHWQRSRSECPGPRPLFGYTQLTLQRCWEEALVALRLPALVGNWSSTPELRLTAGGLRAGGATAHYLRFQALDALQWRGRWRSAATLEHYIQLAAYCWAAVELRDPTASLVRHYGTIAQDFLTAVAAHPPVSSFSRERWKGPLFCGTGARVVHGQPTC